MIFRAHYRMDLNHQKSHFRDSENDRSAIQPINSWTPKRVDVERQRETFLNGITQSHTVSSCFMLLWLNYKSPFLSTQHQDTYLKQAESHSVTWTFRPQHLLARGVKKAWVGGFHSTAVFSADITPSETDKPVYTSKASPTDWTEEVPFTNTHCKTIDAAEEQTATSSSWEVLAWCQLVCASVLWGLQFRLPQQFRWHATQGQEMGMLGVKLSDILQSLTIYKLNKLTLVIIVTFLPI